LRPCDEPAWSSAEIKTDVDLMGLVNRYRSAWACSSDKIRAINRIYHPQAERAGQ